MIISERVNDDKGQFESILKRANDALNVEAKKRPSFFINQSSDFAENIVYEYMVSSSIGTSFQDKIYLFAGHSFPDIVVDTIYGVEVKSTTKDHWTTTGNSVMESTRKKNIEFIYLFFAKFATPIGFRFRPYQDCLSEVAVTHSPRYKVDMELNQNETIFSKMGISYDELISTERPLKIIKEYLRSIAKNGEEPWWLDEQGSINETDSPMVRLYSGLTKLEKRKIQSEIFARFPEIFSKSTKKYSRPVSYLAANYGVVTPNFRDEYTAGGVWSTMVNDRVFKKLPQIFHHVYQGQQEIIRAINMMDADDIKFYWKLTNINDRLQTWVDLVCENIDIVEQRDYFRCIFP